MKIKIRGLVFVGFAAAVFAQSAMAEITADDKTVTSKTYVDSKVEATVSGETTINSESPDDKAPSSLNVYKFVTDQMDDLAEVAAIQGDGTYLNVTTETVGTGDNAHEVKQVNVITNNLASTAALIGTAGTSAQAADQGKLTTAKAVYDFVTGGDDPDGGFHPKLTSTQASILAGWGNGGQSEEGTAIAVGYRAYDGDDPDAVEPSEWKTFGARANGSGTNDDYHLSYLTVQPGTYQERDKYFIDIKATALAKDVMAISAGGTATGAAASQTADKLATAKAVYDYAVQKQWQTTDEGKHLVIGSDGKVTLSTNTNPDIPAPTDTRCTQAGGNHVCALVAYYDANAGGTGVGGVKYEWTVMAPTGSTGGGSGGGSGSGTGGGTGA